MSEMSPNAIKQIVDAIQQLPAWQWLESQMAAAEAEGHATASHQETDTVGAALPPQARQPQQHLQMEEEMPQPRDGRVMYTRGFASPAWARR